MLPPCRRSNYIRRSCELLHTMNMGATAVGTGLNADPEYIKEVCEQLTLVTGESFTTADNLVDATSNTDIFTDLSSSLKTSALSLIKISNDLRLMASGPQGRLLRNYAAAASARFLHHAG